MKRVRSLFLQMAPLKVVVQSLNSIENWPSIELQDELVSLVLSQIKIFPQSKKYVHGFVKLLTRYFDETSCAVSDLLAEFIINNCVPINIDEENDECFHCLPLPNDSLLPLRVSRIHNQVGMKIWDAGLFLAEICIRGAGEIFSGKTVIELGAGVGATSLTAVKSIEKQYLPRKLFVTEGPLEVVENLKENISRNKLNKLDGPAGAICEVIAQKLDWSECDKSNCPNVLPDVVLAADCTYSEDMSMHLVQTIDCLLASTLRFQREHHFSPSNQFYPSITDSGCAQSCSTLSDAIDLSPLSSQALQGPCNSKEPPFALIACTVRDLVTYEHFIGTLHSCPQLQAIDVTLWARDLAGEQIFYYEGRESIRILRITCK